MRYSLTIDPRIVERYPHYTALIIYAEDVQNTPSNAESAAMLRDAERFCRETLTKENFSQIPHIEAWRNAYKSFGVKPKKYPCSVEALLARTLSGQDLPRINCVVDVYNAISIQHILPVGGEDWDQLKSDLRLTFATGEEPFETMEEGKEVITYPSPGEVIWADEAGVTCRRWSWRQGRRTRLTTETKAIYFILERLAPYSIETLQAAGDDLIQLIKRFSPATKISMQWLGEQAK